MRVTPHLTDRLTELKTTIIQRLNQIPEYKMEMKNYFDNQIKQKIKDQAPVIAGCVATPVAGITAAAKAMVRISEQTNDHDADDAGDAGDAGDADDDGSEDHLQSDQLEIVNQILAINPPGDLDGTFEALMDIYRLQGLIHENIGHTGRKSYNDRSIHKLRAGYVALANETDEKRTLAMLRYRKKIQQRKRKYAAYKSSITH
jgi:hypothetical protein